MHALLSRANLCARFFGLPILGLQFVVASSELRTFHKVPRERVYCVVKNIMRVSLGI